MLISPSKIRQMFKDKNQRVPRNFTTALNTLVVTVVEKAAAGEELSKEVLTQEVNNFPVLLPSFCKAIDELSNKHNGQTPLEVIFARAKELQAKSSQLEISPII